MLQAILERVKLSLKIVCIKRKTFTGKKHQALNPCER